MEFEIVDDETSEEIEGKSKPKTISGIKIIEKTDNKENHEEK